MVSPLLISFTHISAAQPIVVLRIYKKKVIASLPNLRNFLDCVRNGPSKQINIDEEEVSIRGWDFLVDANVNTDVNANVNANTHAKLHAQYWTISLKLPW